MKSKPDNSANTVTERFEVELPEVLAQTVREQRKHGNVSITITVKNQ